MSKPGNQRGQAAVRHASMFFIALLALPGCATDFVTANNSPGTTFGKIYVDSPEVYSRERLVKDRFQQDAWLREKLRQVPEHGLQGSMSTSSSRNTTVALAAGVKPQTPATGQPATPTAPQEAMDAPVEQFRDAMAYREEVRNEILENQLDDRHDIAGNTLYRLKFDATVLPLHDTSAYAMVEVKISGSSIWNTGGDERKRSVPGDPFEVEGMVLPNWEFASYVPGLDERALALYSQAYEEWARDIDPDKYSRDDIRYGALQRYFDVTDNGYPLELSKKEHCEDYRDDVRRNAALEELVARGVPREYLQAQTYTDELTDGEIIQVTTYELLCVQTGLANFIADLRDHEATIYTYIVTPKERVQKVSGESLSKGATGLSVGAEQGVFGAALAHSSALEARANAIMRQPQVVGFSTPAHRSDEATMGWLIGPRYRISSNPDGPVSFRHVPAQHTLTGIISVPSWWTGLTLETRTYWLDENGVEFSEEGQPLSPDGNRGTTTVTTIALPGDLTSIADIFDPKRREPRVQASTGELDELTACERGSLIIRGSQLWRSTVVTLGGQQADSILVLPNMEGIIASFNSVEPSISGSEELFLWTSEGETHVRTVSIRGECKDRLES